MPTETIIAPSSVIDRELRCQGTSLAAWASARGIPTHALASVLDGTRKDPAGLLDDLAATIGVSTASLVATAE